MVTWHNQIPKILVILLSSVINALCIMGCDFLSHGNSGGFTAIADELELQTQNTMDLGFTWLFSLFFLLTFYTVYSNIISLQ